VALDLFEIGKKRCPPPIIEIVAAAAIASAATVTPPSASEGVLDRHALAQASATGTRISESA
jgi:hypothetical protein